jgi:hypothetical protein
MRRILSRVPRHHESAQPGNNDMRDGSQRIRTSPSARRLTSRPRSKRPARPTKPSWRCLFCRTARCNAAGMGCAASEGDGVTSPSDAAADGESRSLSRCLADRPLSALKRLQRPCHRSDNDGNGLSGWRLGKPVPAADRHEIICLEVVRSDGWRIPP